MGVQHTLTSTVALDVNYIGNHGGELLRPRATQPEVDPDVADWTARVREFAARVYSGEHPPVMSLLPVANARATSQPPPGPMIRVLAPGLI